MPETSDHPAELGEAGTTTTPTDELLAAVAGITDPADRLLVARSLETGPGHEALSVIRAHAVRDLKTSGLTWPVIGSLIGVTAQRAEQLSKA